MLSLRTFLGRRPDDLVLGRTGKYSFFPKFRISARSRQFHTYVVGLTGRGKSKFLQNCLVQDILAGRGCGINDPHGDLAKDVMSSLVVNRGHSPFYSDQTWPYSKTRDRKSVV